MTDLTAKRREAMDALYEEYPRHPYGEEQHEGAADGPLCRFVLVQYSEQAGENWHVGANTPSELAAYQAQDEGDWYPVVIVDLDTGQEADLTATWHVGEFK